mmetsp:Transcript_21235/g.58308  ORF Transcript_21235/g.58308 Transcript_21235/m.58308 type:complete len:125 (+) Transcript_21235:161-535(+)
MAASHATKIATARRILPIYRPFGSDRLSPELKDNLVDKISDKVRMTLQYSNISAVNDPSFLCEFRRYGCKGALPMPPNRVLSFSYSLGARSDRVLEIHVHSGIKSKPVLWRQTIAPEVKQGQRK